jgi:hypothetical protein
MLKHKQSRSCRFCGNELTGKQDLYCSRRCKDRFWNLKRKQQIEGFKTFTVALQKAGLLPPGEDL